MDAIEAVGDIRIEAAVGRIGFGDAKRFISAYHYLHDKPFRCVVAYGLFLGRELGGGSGLPQHICTRDSSRRIWIS